MHISWQNFSETHLDLDVFDNNILIDGNDTVFYSKLLSMKYFVRRYRTKFVHIYETYVHVTISRYKG